MVLTEFAEEEQCSQYMFHSEVIALLELFKEYTKVNLNRSYLRFPDNLAHLSVYPTWVCFRW